MCRGRYFCYNPNWEQLVAAGRLRARERDLESKSKRKRPDHHTTQKRVGGGRGLLCIKTTIYYQHSSLYTHIDGI